MSICEIVGEDRFYSGSRTPKRPIFSIKIFFFRFYRKSLETNYIELHDTYVLFRTFFSQVNNKWFFFRSGSPLKMTVKEGIRFEEFFLIVCKNCYGSGNNVWKFQVSMMKIVPMACIWSSFVICIMMTRSFHKGKGDNIW